MSDTFQNTTEPSLQKHKHGNLMHILHTAGMVQLVCVYQSLYSLNPVLLSVISQPVTEYVFLILKNIFAVKRADASAILTICMHKLLYCLIIQFQ